MTTKHEHYGMNDVHAAHSRIVTVDECTDVVYENLHLEGRVVNLMSTDLQMVDKLGKLRSTFRAAEKPLEIWWVHPDILEAGVAEAELVRVDDLQLAVSGPVRVIGWLNSFFGLVAPLNETDVVGVRQFWQKAVQQRRAEVRNVQLIERDKLQKRELMPVYWLVSRGMALVMHYRGCALKNLLVPAVACEMAETGKIGYQALMPAEYLWKES